MGKWWGLRLLGQREDPLQESHMQLGGACGYGCLVLLSVSVICIQKTAHEAPMQTLPANPMPLNFDRQLFKFKNYFLFSLTTSPSDWCTISGCWFVVFCCCLTWGDGKEFVSVEEIYGDQDLTNVGIRWSTKLKTSYYLLNRLNSSSPSFVWA